MKYYTGIGSRSVPDDIYQMMVEIGTRLAKHGVCLRSGAADGADSAFEQGCDEGAGEKEIYLPWKGFNNHKSDLCISAKEAYELAKQYYTVGTLNLNTTFRKAMMVNDFMARNVHQVLGQDLKTPSSFVVCWTQDGCESGETRTKKTGGTGQAISVATAYSIPVFNLYRPVTRDIFLESMKEFLA